LTPKPPGLLATGQLAEALGFDAFLPRDHLAWELEGWMHLAALAVKTKRIRLGTNFQELVDAGIKYFIVQMLDATDEETIRLLAEQVVPAIRK